MRPILLFLTALVFAGPSFAQKSPKENARVWLGINCSIYAAADYDLTMSSTQPGEAMPLDETFDNWVNLSTAVSPGNLRAQITPGRLYSFSVVSSNWTTADLHFDVPAGYTLYMGYPDQGRTPITSYLANSTAGTAYTVTLELRPNDRAVQLPAGRSLAPQVDDVSWAVSLGFTATGESAGTIRWRQPAVTTDLLNAINLDYVDPVADEVLVERYTDGALKYISSFQCQVRVFRETDPTTGYTINFYAWDADPGTDRNFTGVSALTSYHVSSPSSGAVRIIHLHDGPTKIWLLSVSGSTTTVSQMSDTTTSVRDFEFVSAADTPATGQRTVTITTKYTGGSAASVVQKIYQDFDWGEELISETADPGTSPHANLTTTYAYYSSGWAVSGSATSGNAGKLASVSRPDGSWERYDYHDDTAKWGQLAHVYRPWQDSPTAAASATTTNCHVTTYLYDGQRAVYDDISAGTQTTIAGTQAAGSSATFGFGTQTDYNASPYGAPIRTINLTNNALSGSSLSSTRKVFDTGVIPATGGNAAVAAQPGLAGRLYSQTNADGTRTSAAYSVGDWTSYLGDSVTIWDTYSFTPNGSGSWRAESYFQGNSTAVTGADGTALSSWNGHAIEPVYLTPFRSTRRDVYTLLNNGLTQELTYVYTGSGNFKLIAWKHTDYVNGLLWDSYDSTGARQDWRYTGGRLTSETHADGTETVYTLDTLYRVTRAQRKGVAATGGFPAQGDINTDYTYNAADQVLTTTTAPAAGGLSLTSSATYNLAGQITASVDERGLSTGYSYANGGRTVTVALPGGATKITERWRDGSIKSVTGTAVVPAYQEVTVNTSNGTLTAAAYSLRTSDLSTPTSAPRWSKVTTDWLGRTIKEEKPAPPDASPSTFAKEYFYYSNGQLKKTTETGLAPTYFKYDGQGELEYSWLDTDNDTNDTAPEPELGGPDRVTRSRSKVVEDGGVWWRQSLNYAYGDSTTNDTSALLQAETRTRLVPYAGSGSDFSAWKVRTEAHTYDIFRNLTVQTAVVDRASRVATVTTNVPDSSIDSVETSLNGLKVQSQTAQNLTYNYLYDALGRSVSKVDPRLGADQTVYRTGSSEVEKYYDPYAKAQLAGNPSFQPTATYVYEESSGRLSVETNAQGKATRYAYNKRGQTIQTWGAATYPVETAFNDYGESYAQRTFAKATEDFTAAAWPRSDSGLDSTTGNPTPTSWNASTSDKTLWTYHDATGTLTSKTDAASETVSYTYTARGQLKTRTWARGVTTTYAYSTTTAEQTGIDYSDTTPDLTYTYNRLGQTATVKDAIINGTESRVFNYSPTTMQLTQEDLGSFADTRSVAYQYDSLGRRSNLGHGPTATPTSEYSVAYTYDTYGRMNQVWTFTYSYLPSSNLLSAISDSTSSWTQARTYESNRDLLAVIETKWSTASKAKFDYASDTLGRRTTVAKTGEMFARYSAAGLDTDWGYNDRSELTSEISKLGGTATVLTGRNDAYSFDNLGNRASTAGTTHNGTSSGYTANSLNQYTQRDVSGIIDVSGLAPAASDVKVAGDATGITRHNDWYFKSHAYTGSRPAWQTLALTDWFGSAQNGDTIDRSAFLPTAQEAFTYDLDGNLTRDGRWVYQYDAENRLIAQFTRGASDDPQTTDGDSSNDAANTAVWNSGVARQKIQFTNDYLGRRVSKLVSDWDAGTSTWIPANAKSRKYVYDGWNLIAEYAALPSLALTRTYAWGLDWSGTLQGAGGVGGLLYTYDYSTSTVLLPMFDGNGNVMGMIKQSDGTMAAAYEYDAFGNTLRATGAYAASNPFRFSTKYTDVETGLVYYGLRYYSPTLGRFINRDPIEEQGGLNLYGFCSNNGVNRWDYLGMVEGRAEEDARVTAALAGFQYLGAQFQTLVNSYKFAQLQANAINYELVAQAQAASSATWAADSYAGFFKTVADSQQAAARRAGYTGETREAGYEGGTQWTEAKRVDSSGTVEWVNTSEIAVSSVGPNSAGGGNQSHTQGGTIVEIAYTRVPFQKDARHTFIILRDGSGKNITPYATRAGREGTVRLGNLTPQSSPYPSSYFLDKPGEVILTQEVGRSPYPFDDMVEATIAYERIVRDEKIPYSGRGNNSNTYTWTYLDWVHLPRPEPRAFVPGYENQLKLPIQIPKTPQPTKPR